MSQDIATPETLEQLADDHAATGLLISAATFRAMAKAWKATEKALADAQAENSLLQGVLNKAREAAARAEAAAITTHNTLAANGTKPLRSVDQQVAA
jgi:hypothetical protein